MDEHLLQESLRESAATPAFGDYLKNRSELSSRFPRSESRQDFRNCGVPKRLASFATEFSSGLLLNTCADTLLHESH